VQMRSAAKFSHPQTFGLIASWSFRFWHGPCNEARKPV
jgi:hypothetical protein